MLKKDCRHFRGDKPCIYHKQQGIKCENCDYYNPIKFKILIVKLDAIGDVLRTTSILPALKRKYPDSHIIWCTRSNAKELFVLNDLVDEVITIELDAFFRVQSERFNLVINLDSSKLSSSVASMAKAEIKIGFVFNEKGFVEATNPAAEHWLIMSAFDDEKKKNEKTHQQVMFDILDLKEEVSKPILKITEKARRNVSSKLLEWNFNKNLLTIGLNIGVGLKWQSKKWPLKNWEELILQLQEKEYNTLLLGGSEEKDELIYLKNKYDFLINTGSDNTLMDFAAVVDLCEVVVTCDTLALHIATALNKKIIALFGPTSLSEIDLFGNGIKLTADEECKCYYSRFCSLEVSCMEKITSKTVLTSVLSLVDSISK